MNGLIRVGAKDEEPKKAKLETRNLKENRNYSFSVHQTMRGTAYTPPDGSYCAVETSWPATR